MFTEIFMSITSMIIGIKLTTYLKKDPPQSRYDEIIITEYALIDLWHDI